MFLSHLEYSTVAGQGTLSLNTCWYILNHCASVLLQMQLHFMQSSTQMFAVTRMKFRTVEVWNLPFFLCVLEKLLGTSVFKVTNITYIYMGQRDKWCGFGTEAVP
jgi:hypothetical protein